MKLDKCINNDDVPEIKIPHSFDIRNPDLKIQTLIIFHYIQHKPENIFEYMRGA